MSTPAPAAPTAPLTGLRVLDLATLFAGPFAATVLGDFGAEAVKAEHPDRPAPSRGHGPSKDGVGQCWKLLGRSERTITPNLSTPGGRDTLRRLAADVLDDAVGGRTARHGRAEVPAAFEEAEAAVAPVQDVRDVMTGPRYRALDAVTTVDDPEPGPLRMQHVLFRLSAAPGAIRRTGRPHGADTEEVLTGPGLPPGGPTPLREAGAA
ncbi:CoA transferase [Streptomyces sp. HMX87]|uniref:CoA transferase n=1 Tax=Streptomyces sp. HMX87 TaxID=3390849 RepID=UPI003A8ABF2A